MPSQLVEIEDRTKQGRNRRRARHGITQRPDEAVDERLIDTGEVKPTELGLHEIEETQGPVGLTPHRSRFKPGAMSRHSDVQPGMEKLAQGIGNGRVFNTVEMHRDVATPRIIPKYAG